MRCEDVRERGVIEQYVTARLTDPEREAFEEHFFECDSCFEAVELATAVREGFESGARTSFDPRRLAPWRRLSLAAAAVLLIATGLILYRSSTPPPDPAIVALGRLAEVPPYFPEPAVRGGAERDSAQELFEEGMALYVAGDFEAAVPTLEASLILDPTPGRSLYLAAARLRSGDARGALGALEIAGTEPLLTERSRFYSALAHLQLGDTQAALEVLRGVEDGEGEFAVEARPLAERVQQLSGW